MQSNSTVKSRLGEFLKYKGIGQAKFAESVGLSRGFANNVGDSIRAENLAKITAIYPELNTTWLLTGEGAMLKASAVPQVEPAPASPAAAQPDMVSIPREVWEVIRNQAASLKDKDASIKMKDQQMDDLLAMLREERQRGDGADDLFRAASQAAAD